MNKSRRSRRNAFILGCLAWALAFVAALRFGSVPDVSSDLIWTLRFPRALLAGAVGMGLAVAGSALQAVFSNPLCEPYTLGISSGAALGAVLGSALGIQWFVAGMAGSALLGALLFTALLFMISLKPGSTAITLLLSGVMLQFLGSSLVALALALSDASGVQSAITWLLGDLSRARLKGAEWVLSSTLLLAGLLWSESKNLDALLLGEEDAASIGAPVARTRRKVILIVSVMVGLGVSAAGMIGFVGLVVPHFARKFSGSLHRALIPLCAVWGAALLTAADVAARWVARPLDLPVGVVTAIAGAPLFLWAVIQRKEGA